MVSRSHPASDANFMAMAKQTRKAVIEECDAGLMKVVVPIIVDGEFIGAVGAVVGAVAQLGDGHHGAARAPEVGVRDAAARAEGGVLV